MVFMAISNFKNTVATVIEKRAVRRHKRAGKPTPIAEAVALDSSGMDGKAPAGMLEAGKAAVGGLAQSAAAAMEAIKSHAVEPEADKPDVMESKAA
jgi:hypothetical protein